MIHVLLEVARVVVLYLVIGVLFFVGSILGFVFFSDLLGWALP